MGSRDVWSVATLAMCSLAVFITSAVLFVVTSSNGEAATEPSDSPVVQTSYGPVRGYTFTSSWTSRTIYAFHGIPYAAPPVGDLRFRDPVLPEKWTSVKDCSEDQNSCMQPKIQNFNRFNFLFSMSEDCLYLNVFTPRLNPKGGLFPVMVWVHGGGFLEGSGSRFRYGPDFLVAEGVVVVSINYRLGAFGFLTLGTSEIPGNAGLKDQRLALQWVQREISQFGGDPGKVTLFGESAGSASVHFHYLSPFSKGLFHRAIGESGTALNWAFRADGSAYGLRLASVLGCKTQGPSSTTHKCLLQASGEAILLAQGLVTPTEEDTQDGLGLVFIPSVDRLSSMEPFLPDIPSQLKEQRQGSSVRFMMGINKDEGLLMLTIQPEDVVQNVTNYLEYYISREKRNRSPRPRINTLVERIKTFYFKESNNYSDFIKSYINLTTDFSFGYTTAESAKAFRGRSDVYLYYFTFQGSFKENMFEEIESKHNISAVSHGEELNYLFVRKKINQTAAADSREITTWRRMARMWTNFAKYGAPTVGADSLLQDVSWAPVGVDSTRYLRIDDNLTMETADFLGPSVALWDSVTPSSGYLPLPTNTKIMPTNSSEH